MWNLQPVTQMPSTTVRGKVSRASSPPLAESYVNTASAFFNWFVRSRNDSDNKGSFARGQQLRTVRASSKSAYLRVTSTQQPPRGGPSPSGKGRGYYERLRAAPRTTPSISTPPDTDDATRHEADRQADVASERDDEQRDPCDNEPLLCIRHRSHLIN
jgi:hypothetical protein